MLAYSIIMLTTDLHSPQVKKKMSLGMRTGGAVRGYGIRLANTCCASMLADEFIRNNRGINDGKDLPREFLLGIYNDIRDREIRVQGDRSGATKAQYSSARMSCACYSQLQQHMLNVLSPLELLNEKTRKMLYHQEMESRLLAAQALLAGKERSNTAFTSAQNIAYVKPMFLSVWATMLAVFRHVVCMCTGVACTVRKHFVSCHSVLFKSSNELYVTRLCLDGYAHAIHISAVFALDLQRNAFVQSLVSFSALLSGDFKLDNKKVGLLLPSPPPCPSCRPKAHS